MERRLVEAARQGFNIALIPPGCDGLPAGMRALAAPTIVAALEHMIDIADHRASAPPGPQRLDA
jgi:DNA repair protein RadA/Sms